MKQIVLALATLFCSVTAFAQASDYDVSTDKETGFTVFKGQVTFEDLLKEPSFNWLSRNAAAYTPDSNAIKYLKKNLPQYDLVILMGTWCDDSHLLIPRLYKVMQASVYPTTQYQMFGVDRAKQAKYVEHRLYHLEKVPTIILTRNHSEIGRIVEKVKRNVEVDLVQMIQKDIDLRESGRQ